MSNLKTEKYCRFEIPKGESKKRLDVFLTNVIENSTRTKVQKLIDSGNVFVNGKSVKSNYKISPGDIVEAEIPISPRPENIEPEDIHLNIIFEDEYIIIVNKPAGMTVHPAFGNYTGTLVNALLHRSNSLSDYHEDPARPGIIHRIDKNTSGLIVCAKDGATHAKLAEQFSKHTIEREYWAICWGLFKKKEGEINENIGRSKSDRKKFAVCSKNEGKTAITFYKVIEEFEFLSLVKLNLKTGRTHQIRVHLSHLNHPIFSDETYGGRKIVFGSELPKIKSRVENLLEILSRQALHAKTLGFFHPWENKYFKFDSELPEDMQKALESIR